MFANIPIEIQVEIIKRVPVKSLIRFRSVSKQWKSLIDSPEFITDHRLNQTQPHHLLVMHHEASDFKYVSIVDDDSLIPHHKFSPSVTPTVKLVKLPTTLLGCAHGTRLFNYCKTLIVLWNPSIRKSLGIALPCGVDALGFGVCLQTNDPKLVKITHTIHYHYQAQVFTLISDSGAWGRSVSMNLPLPHESMCFVANTVVIDGVIHWLTYGLTTNTYRIISFDLTSEEFGKVDLPDTLACSVPCRYLYIYKFKESLVLLDYCCRGVVLPQVCNVWMMSAKSSSFTKQFTLRDVDVYSIIGFRKIGQTMLRFDGELQVYDPATDSMNGLGIYGVSFMMAAYTESLLLLNHFDSIIQ